MIEAFVDSWGLFADTYLAGWAVAVLLSLVGVWVVARDQIFLGAAVSQASTLGTAVAIWLQGVTVIHALRSDALRTVTRMREMGPASSLAKLLAATGLKTRATVLP